MPVIYRVDYDGEETRVCKFFEKKGEATQFRRAQKERSPDPAEKLTLRSRTDLVGLLNSLVTGGVDEPDAAESLGFL